MKRAYSLSHVKFLIFLIFVAILFAPIVSAIEPPAIEWNNTFGGDDDDIGYSVQQTSDGGYIIAGTTQSFGYGGYASPDLYVIKTNSSGNLEWNKTFGGEEDEGGGYALQTSDGGYIIAGSTKSFNVSYSEIYLVKLDSSGNPEWEKTLGTESWAKAIQQTSDNGYIITGHARIGSDYDVYLLKINSSGNMEWNNTFDRSGYDSGKSVQQTSDGGYIIAGYNEHDVYLIKTDSSGNLEWERTFGGRYTDNGYSVQQTSDGGYVIIGKTDSLDYDSNDNIYLIKTDSSGNLEWEKTFETGEYTGHFIPYFSVQQTSDGGYILLGDSAHGSWNRDFYLIKTDFSGNLEWEKVFGSENDDHGKSLQQTSDGGYVITGSMAISGPWDPLVYLAKLSPETFDSCSDGTPYGFCSSQTPLYCDSGSLVSNCQFCGCSSGYICQPDGTCQEGNCSVNSDCGTDGWLGEPFCCSDDICQRLKSYMCHNESEPSYCSIREASSIKQDCPEYCDDWGDEYCGAGGYNIYHNRTCYDDICSNATCGYEPYFDDAVVEYCWYGCNDANGNVTCITEPDEPRLLFYESFDNESSILSNNGTTGYGTPSFVQGIKNNAMDGTSSFYVKYPIKNNFYPYNGTIEFWIKPRTTRMGFFDIARLSGAHPNSIGMFYNVGHAITEIRNERAYMTQIWSSGGLTGPYSWYYITFTWERSNNRCSKGTTYINGVPGDSRTYCDFYPNMTRDFWVGRSGWYGSSYSVTDEFKIYNYAKSDEELRQEYESVIELNTPVIVSYSPQETVFFVDVGTSQEFSIEFAPPQSREISITWFVNNLPVKNETGNISSLTHAIDSLGLDTIEVVADSGGFLVRKSWYMLARANKTEFAEPGLFLNDSQGEWIFSIPSDVLDSAKQAMLIVESVGGLYSEEPWNLTQSGATITVNGQNIAALRNEFYCSGAYHGYRCFWDSIRFPVPVSMLQTQTTIAIAASNSVWDIDSVRLVLDPNERVYIADEKFYLDGGEFLIKGASYAPWLQGTGPEPSQEPFPGEYEEVTYKVGDDVPDYNNNGIIEAWEVIEYDLEVMDSVGVNNIRTYSAGEWHDQNLDGIIDLVGNCNKSEIIQGDVPNWLYDRLLTYALQRGMTLTLGYWVQEEDYIDRYPGGSCTYLCNWTDLEVAKDTMRRIVERYGEHPSLISWGIGNEVHLPQNHAWFSWGVDINEYLNRLCNYTKSIDPHPRSVMYAKYIGEDADFSNLWCYDIIAPNAYIFPANDSRILNEFSVTPPASKTYLMGEYGHIIEYAEGLWELAMQYAGGDFLEYNDVWWKGYSYLFGIVDARRNIKPDIYGVLVCLYNKAEWLRGDVNADDVIDIFDLAIVGVAYGSQPGDPNWRSYADVNGDGRIDIFDLATVGMNYGRSC